MDGPSAGRPEPGQVSTEDELGNYLRALMAARTNVRAVAAETGLSKTTVNELRTGRRRASLDAVTKIVGAYAPDEVGAARQAWHHVQPPRPSRGAPPADAVAAAGPLPPASARAEAATGSGPAPIDAATGIADGALATGTAPAAATPPPTGAPPTGTAPVTHAPPATGNPSTTYDPLTAGILPATGTAPATGTPPVPGAPPGTGTGPMPGAPPPAGSPLASGAAPMTDASPVPGTPPVTGNPPVTGTSPARGTPPASGAAPVGGAAATTGTAVVPVTSSRANRWLPVGAWPRVVYAALVALSLVAVADGVRAVAGRWSDDARPASGTADTGACITPAQETEAELTPLPAQDTAPTAVVAAAYHLQRSDPPRLEIAATLTRPPPAGTVVQLLERADPTTVDSTPEHNPGNGRHYPRPSIRTVGRCVFVPQGQIGYDGFAGIRVRYTAVLMPAEHERTIVADSHAGDGLSEQDLARYSLVQLGHFEFRV